MSMPIIFLSDDDEEEWREEDVDVDGDMITDFYDHVGPQPGSRPEGFPAVAQDKGKERENGKQQVQEWIDIDDDDDEDNEGGKGRPVEDTDSQIEGPYRRPHLNPMPVLDRIREQPPRRTENSRRLVNSPQAETPSSNSKDQNRRLLETVWGKNWHVRLATCNILPKQLGNQFIRELAEFAIKEKDMDKVLPVLNEAVKDRLKSPLCSIKYPHLITRDILKARAGYSNVNKDRDVIMRGTEDFSRVDSAGKEKGKGKGKEQAPVRVEESGEKAKWKGKGKEKELPVPTRAEGSSGNKMQTDSSHNTDPQSIIDKAWGRGWEAKFGKIHPRRITPPFLKKLADLAEKEKNLNRVIFHLRKAIRTRLSKVRPTSGPWLRSKRLTNRDVDLLWLRYRPQEETTKVKDGDLGISGTQASHGNSCPRRRGDNTTQAPSTVPEAAEWSDIDEDPAITTSKGTSNYRENTDMDMGEVGAVASENSRIGNLQAEPSSARPQAAIAGGPSRGLEALFSKLDTFSQQFQQAVTDMQGAVTNLASIRDMLKDVLEENCVRENDKTLAGGVNKLNGGMNKTQISTNREQISRVVEDVELDEGDEVPEMGRQSAMVRQGSVTIRKGPGKGWRKGTGAGRAGVRGRIGIGRSRGGLNGFTRGMTATESREVTLRVSKETSANISANTRVSRETTTNEATKRIEATKQTTTTEVSAGKGTLSLPYSQGTYEGPFLMSTPPPPLPLPSPNVQAPKTTSPPPQSRMVNNGHGNGGGSGSGLPLARRSKAMGIGHRSGSHRTTSRLRRPVSYNEDEDDDDEARLETELTLFASPLRSSGPRSSSLHARPRSPSPLSFRSSGPLETPAFIGEPIIYPPFPAKEYAPGSLPLTIIKPNIPPADITGHMTAREAISLMPAQPNNPPYLPGIPEIQEGFTRINISYVLGGGVQNTFPAPNPRKPHKYSVPGYICAKRSLNPTLPQHPCQNAVMHVMTNDGRRLGKEFPLFIRHKPLEWFYYGTYKLEKYHHLSLKGWISEFTEEERVTWAKHLTEKKWGRDVLRRGGLNVAQQRDPEKARILLERENDEHPQIRLVLLVLKPVKWDNDLYNLLLEAKRSSKMTMGGNGIVRRYRRKRRRIGIGRDDPVDESSEEEVVDYNDVQEQEQEGIDDEDEDDVGTPVKLELVSDDDFVISDLYPSSSRIGASSWKRKRISFG